MDSSLLGSMPMESPGKNTGVGCEFLLQRIFLTQGSNHISCVSCTVGGFFTTEPLGYNKVRNKLGGREVILIDMIATNLLEFIRNIHVYLK